MAFLDGYRTLARIAVAGVLVGAEVVIARHIGSTTGLPGYTLVQSYSVTAPRASRIEKIDVVQGQRVEAGDVIAELDATTIDDEIAEATADHERAQAAVLAASAKLRMSGRDLHQRVASRSERASADLVAAVATAQTAQAELTAVDQEIAARTDLIARHLANAPTADDLAMRKATLEKQVASAQEVLRVLRANASAATDRIDPQGMVASDDETTAILAPLEAEVKATDARLDRLARDRMALTLRAPASGVVDEVGARPGDTATPELAIAVIAAPDARRVVACIPEARSTHLEVGLEADTTTVVGHVKTHGIVESVTGEVAVLPPRCQSPAARVPALGRVAIIALDDDVPGLPGQTQIVQFHARKSGAPVRATPTPPPAPTPTAIADPTFLAVPTALTQVSRFEPSGLVWFPATHQYIIVSDDTGLDGKDGHPPWLFAMSATGVIAPAPLVVGGISALDDLESIALADDGGLWVLASNSLSKSGKRPAARTVLAHLLYRDAQFTVDHSIELAGLLDRAPGPVHDALGITTSTTLDIEGLAARNGALYLGLKAPVDAKGNAEIWRFEHPDQLLAGNLAGAGGAVWMTVTLPVEADGHSTAGGIADLAFLDDTTLAITGTASTGDPKTQSGILTVVRIADHAALQTAAIVRTYAGEKPEGITLAPDGASLTVVFDRGAAPPKWTSVPLDAFAARSRVVAP